MVKQKRKSHSARKPQSTDTPRVSTNHELDRWMTCNINALTASQLSEGAVFLNKAADANAKLGLDVLVVQQRSRAIGLLEAWIKATRDQPEWVERLHEYQLLEAGLACDRIARLAEKKDDAKAAEYWEKGASLFGQLLTQHPSQPAWVATFHERCLRDGGRACNRIAMAARGKDDTKAAECWAKGAFLFEELLNHYPNQPEWVAMFHQSHLREASLVSTS